MDQHGSRIITHVNETPGVTGLMRAEIDEAQAIIRATGSGFWSVAQVDGHFTHLARAVRAFHQRGLAVSVIVDMRGAAPAQSQEVSIRLKAGVSGIYRRGDRVALVLATSLAKMQMRRVLDSEFHAFFLSLSAAEKWAMAGKQAMDPLHALTG